VQLASAAAVSPLLTAPPAPPGTPPPRDWWLPIWITIGVGGGICSCVSIPVVRWYLARRRRLAEEAAARAKYERVLAAKLARRRGQPIPPLQLSGWDGDADSAAGGGGAAPARSRSRSGGRTRRERSGRSGRSGRFGDEFTSPPASSRSRSPSPPPQRGRCLPCGRPAPSQPPRSSFSSRYTEDDMRSRSSDEESGLVAVAPRRPRRAPPPREPTRLIAREEDPYLVVIGREWDGAPVYGFPAAKAARVAPLPAEARCAIQ
jgi:hypothetical protein